MPCLGFFPAQRPLSAPPIEMDTYMDAPRVLYQLLQSVSERKNKVLGVSRLVDSRSSSTTISHHQHSTSVTYRSNCLIFRTRATRIFFLTLFSLALTQSLCI